jgi:hypothetical protein
VLEETIQETPTSENDGRNGARTRSILWLIGTYIGLTVTCVTVAFLTARVLFSVDARFVGPPVVSPHGWYVARISESNCGATCPFSSRIRLADISEHFSRPARTTTILHGNVHPCTVLLRWDDPLNLVVTYPPGSEVNIDKREWAGVTVTFVEREVTGEDRAAAYEVSSLGDCYQRWVVR